MHDMVDQLVSGSGHAAVWSSTGSGQRCWEQSGRCGLHWGCSSGRVVVGRHVLSPREARVDRKCRSGTGRERVVVEEITVAAFVDTPITARRTKSTLWSVSVGPGRQTHTHTLDNVPVVVVSSRVESTWAPALMLAAGGGWLLGMGLCRVFVLPRVAEGRWPM